ncbi:cleavage stimulating factor 64 [Quillaja saponaria]|uniref:Cleavage stimulating factor 64 n=1 Tax=Quillaja saponaria TaxID=32244 RepID=A0AAD7Q366_QUISA|nr:cleavage stimulating factor 64 [Quillaja saponaria]
MATSQHRCVFVGNIPYDATEEQLIEICQEVGPVVSFRLVIDRETGKPKGYGFCEYKDEETALSARRNLQGYEINGRQLRVDFAENDKGADRNREQGRGGPGLTANVDPQKQVGGLAVQGDPLQHQPIGLHIAITAAAVMIRALGGSQAGIQLNQNALQNQPALAHDPLTLHLAKMSRIQLFEIMSELKVMATQNNELARRLLLSRPQLPKALFQAQIMLGMVTPQVLQMPNLREGQVSLPPIGEDQLEQSTAVQTLSRLPPTAQSILPTGLMPRVQEGQNSTLPQNPLVRSHLAATPKPTMQPQIQLPPHANNHLVQHGTLLGQSSSVLPSMRPQLLGSMSVRPPVQIANSSMNQHMRPSLPQHLGRVSAISLGHNTQMVHPNTNIHSSLLPHPPFSDSMNKGGDTSARILEDPNLVHPSISYSNMSSGLSQKLNVVHDSLEPINCPSKLMKLDDGRDTSFPSGVTNMSQTNGASQVLGVGSLPVNAASKAGQMQYSEQQSSQSQLSSDVESVLLQQVLNLTPEQLSSLPPEQQEEVIQLQQALRRDQINSS